MATKRKAAFTLKSPNFRNEGTIDRYVFTLYALKVDKLDASGGTASLAGYMVNGNTIAKTKLVGKFGRKK